MERQWTLERIRAEHPQTIPVLIGGQVVEATIRKFEARDETTLQIGDNYYGTTLSDIVDALNAGKPLEIIPNFEHL